MRSALPNSVISRLARVRSAGFLPPAAIAALALATSQFLQPHIPVALIGDASGTVGINVGTPAQVAVVVDDDESVVETLTRMGYRTRLFR